MLPYYGVLHRKHQLYRGLLCFRSIAQSAASNLRAGTNMEQRRGRNGQGGVVHRLGHRQSLVKCTSVILRRLFYQMCGEALNKELIILNQNKQTEI